MKLARNGRNSSDVSTIGLLQSGVAIFGAAPTSNRQRAAKMAALCEATIGRVAGCWSHLMTPLRVAALN
jgi:hypothetical protein